MQGKMQYLPQGFQLEDVKATLDPRQDETKVRQKDNLVMLKLLWS